MVPLFFLVFRKEYLAAAPRSPDKRKFMRFFDQLSRLFPMEGKDGNPNTYG
jgi:hypothetical protein